MKQDTPSLHVKEFCVIAIILLVALSPFFINKQHMEYDSLADEYCPSYLSGDKGKAYQPVRHPGSPSYELLAVAACGAFKAVGIPQNLWVYSLQILTLFLSLIFLWVLYFDLRVYLSAAAAIIATLVVALHPLFLWMAWAATEDMPAMVLGYLGYSFVRRPAEKYFHWSALCLAISATMKTLCLGFSLAALIYVLFHQKTRAFILWALYLLILGFLFYLPAFVYYRADFLVALKMDHGGTRLIDRPSIGWNLMKSTILFFIPVMFSLVFGYGKKIYYFCKERRAFTIYHIDIFLLILCPFGIMQLSKLHYVYALIVVLSLILAINFYERNLKNKAYLRSIAYPMLTLSLVTIAVLFSAPYSRSYLLPILPAFALLLAKRFTSVEFWLFTLLISYGQMFFYYEFHITPPFFHARGHGFYWAHLNLKANHYNDWGFYNEPFVIGGHH